MNPQKCLKQNGPEREWTPNITYGLSNMEITEIAESRHMPAPKIDNYFCFFFIFFGPSELVT